MIKRVIKITVDAAMFVLFLLLMEYYLLTGVAHEWLGVSLFVLFIVHNALNYKWFSVLFRGRYTPMRIVQTAINFLLITVMIICIVSSVLISGTVFSWLHIGGTTAGRGLHMSATSWAFVLMSVHLGLHFAAFVGMAKKVKMPALARGITKWILRVIVLAVAAYGAVVFVQRAFYEELFLLTEFKFFDYDIAPFVYLLQTAALSATFASTSYYAKKLGLYINKIKKEKRNEKRSGS